MGENAKMQKAKIATIKAVDFDFNLEQTACFIIFFNLYIVGKYIVLCKVYILLLKLNIDVLYSYTCTLSTFYIGLLFTRTVVQRESFI